MQIKANTDFVGGCVVLLIAAFFHLQLGEDFSSYGIYFPQHVLPLLEAMGAILVVRGLIKRKEPKKVVFRINGLMLIAMATGLAWAVLLEFGGFILTSFLSLMVLVTSYAPSDKRKMKNVIINCICVLAVVLFFYYIFSRLLGVTLPFGKIFTAFNR